jgi:hypothetical protein
MRLSFVLPRPRFVLHPVMATLLSCSAVKQSGYISGKALGHCSARACLSLLSPRADSLRPKKTVPKENDTEDLNRVLEPESHVENRTFGVSSVYKTYESR